MKKSKIQDASRACPCGMGKQYDACCRRWHQGELTPTAEWLMRSRYSAFVLLNEPYLLSTWHERTRPDRVEFDPQQTWLGLNIIEAKESAESKAEVEFVARFRIGGGSAARLHERSRFERDPSGRWLYVDGTLMEK